MSLREEFTQKKPGIENIFVFGIQTFFCEFQVDFRKIISVGKINFSFRCWKNKFFVLVDIKAEFRYNIINRWEKPRSGGSIGRFGSYELI
ncbi:MAG: hypothetical protein LUD81_06045, partial [Clostridiales bacterium]|nr:hypothetical protein [Clostridiales bacterium]